MRVEETCVKIVSIQCNNSYVEYIPGQGKLCPDCKVWTRTVTVIEIRGTE